MMHVAGDPMPLSPGRVVLLVEDDPAIRDGVQLLLEDAGLEAAAIANGQAAVTWAEQPQPALVILDLDPPVVDGVAVASFLRARYGALLPILIFSADERAYAKTRHLGPCGLDRKPFDADVLVAAVRGGLQVVHDCFETSGAHLSGDVSPRGRPGRDMPATNGDLATLADELQCQLDASALDGLGPVTLLAGPFADARLAGRTLLADLDHLSSLAEHTGHAPESERWMLLADDVYVLLLRLGRRRDGETEGPNGRTQQAS